MDVDQFLEAIPATNNVSTVASILCVLPTYFLRLEPATYRLVLSVGIVFGLSILAFAMTTVIWPFAPHFDRFITVFRFVVFSPFVIVLIAILACIKRITRVGLWSTVVLACVILDWAGIALFMLALS
ncbi:hypothetical protein [Bradyrhizobium japonicum]|uniref:hypothetical protein n=1 Tax=Bradyrhizobium japonicum TaxID=375 RepID=UPI001BA64DC4|nr:hypothetical protein [Bradyrhizobium japonicum]MBR0959849.1 hypothetical protein [Bradyrhizobium japonicum]